MAESPVPARPLPALPENLRDPDAPQSGWERVREMFQISEYGEMPAEAEFMVKSTMTGLIAGFVYGGVPAARFSREQYIKNSQAEVYLHRVDAVRSAHNAAIRGFIRYGFRWGWRVAAFVTIFNGISFTLSAYRDKVVMSHFAAAGAVTGGLFRMNLGLRGFVGGAFIGGMLGVPVGAVTAALQAVVGENLREQRRRRRRQEYEEKLKEWSDCVQLTDVLVEKIQKAEEESPESEAQRIDELLQQPRNPEQ